MWQQTVCFSSCSITKNYIVWLHLYLLPFSRGDPTLPSYCQLGINLASESAQFTMSVIIIFFTTSESQSMIHSFYWLTACLHNPWIRKYQEMLEKCFCLVWIQPLLYSLRFVIRAQSIYPRCTAAYRLIVRPLTPPPPPFCGFF